ncbi:CHASE2 domain-containing protein [Paenibacillus methanolicus]|uniref:Adenylate cyclase n=1 Tax=Paenibacillus methanolicus TaxID=582686 RepID=A0A5S5CJF3_9BACL|nr:adenylate/guanylate cyclase domain-containing protein [Paenibacillus methanolicus]TYP79654.1 adenylate cyclase [Paenibacillus methanolicus]
MNTSLRKWKWSFNLFILAVLLTVYAFDSLQNVSYSLVDYNARQAAEGVAPHEDIVVVAIDEESIQTLGQFPWSRDVYISFLQALEQEQNRPKAIAFDILFTDPGEDPQIDADLAAELRKHDNVILPSYINTENAFTRTTIANKSAPLQAQEIVKPIPEFSEAVHPAHINRLLDDDGVIRRTWLQIETPEGKIPSLAFQAAKMYGADVDHFLGYSDPGPNPLSEVTIQYVSDANGFMTIPFSYILTGDVPLENFKDRIVLVGYTSAGVTDEGVTPIEKSMKLVYAHANIVNQLINNVHIQVIPPWVDLAGMLVLYVLTLFLVWRFRSIWALLYFVIGLALLLGGQYYLYPHHVVLTVTYTMFALVLTFLVNITIKSFAESLQKNFITKQFGRYISPVLVQKIVKDNIEIELGGVSKEATIMFLDIRGFTGLSEKLTPEEVVDFLNTMFNFITKTTLDNHGSIDKFIGDAAMIIFNAPLDVKEHEYYAVKTALEIQQGMVAIRQSIFEKHGVTVNVGIGINTGTVVVGNIGSFLRIDYTAIGDNVNIAARIESSTTAGQVLVSESTYEATKSHFRYEYVGEKLFKGKSSTINVYEPTGPIGESGVHDSES